MKSPYLIEIEAHLNDLEALASETRKREWRPNSPLAGTSAIRALAIVAVAVIATAVVPWAG